MSENFDTPEEKLAARRSNTRSSGAERNVRQPQDHQTKQRKPKKNNVAETELEFRGEVYEVYPEVLDDWEMIEQAQEMGDRGDMWLVREYLGDSYELVKEDLRDPETGRIHKDDMIEFFAYVGDVVRNLNQTG